MRPINEIALVALVAATAGTAGPTPAAQRATGDVAAAACVSCHGEKGEGNAEIGLPALAGLPRDYFVKQIRDFKSGKRISPMKTPYDERLTNSEVLRTGDPDAAADFYAHWMVGVAKGISIEDAKAAADYYARAKRPKAQPAAHSPSKAGAQTQVDPQVLALGEELAIDGDWDRGIPPCFKCHAIGGVGVAPGFPPLAGQHAAYVARQLKAWKSGARANDPLDLMKKLSENLTDDDIQAVAAYFATLKLPGEER